MFNEALNWDGAQWSLVTTPDPDGVVGGSNNQLFAPACTSASNCWAVGSYSGTGTVLSQALRWNGSTWTQVSTPDLGGTANLDSNTLNGQLTG